MKIIEIIPQLSSGGAERFVVDLCNELAGRHEVILVVLHNVDKYGFFSKELHKNVRLVSMNKRMGLDVRLFFRLFLFIKRERPHVVHTHLNGIMYTLLAYMCLQNISFVHTVHNDAAKEAGGGLAKWCRKLAFKWRKVHPVTISEESQRSFEEFYHLPSTLIYNGRPVYNGPVNTSVALEIESLKVRKEATVIVNIARIAEAKNQLALTQAIDELNRTGVAIELFLIGAVLNKEIYDAIVQLHSPYVHLMGVRPNPRDYMQAADAFCLPSVYEGMPITLIECFSVGAIPLCTPIGGMINMIQDGINGLLAKGTDKQDIIDLLKRFCQMSREDKVKMRHYSKCAFEAFDMHLCAQHYIRLFQNL